MTNLSEKTGNNFDTIEVISYKEDAVPEGTDNDLGELLNLWSIKEIKKRQIHPVFRTFPGKRKPNILMIGDSFAFTLIRIMETNHLFAQCDLLYYFKRRFSWPAGINHPIDFSKLDLQKELLNRDAIIIEINEYWLPQYGFGLLRPAIAALEEMADEKK